MRLILVVPWKVLFLWKMFWFSISLINRKINRYILCTAQNFVADDLEILFRAKKRINSDHDCRSYLIFNCIGNMNIWQKKCVKRNRAYDDLVNVITTVLWSYTMYKIYTWLLLLFNINYRTNIIWALRVSPSALPFS